ncbi:hypothetical protein B0H17DRAFT_1129573 [Mycena rosella]|uniref:Uncharacterized protein n=1 Tax=Mycena rosella TaxID=1033263 RepID=A0AAD7GNB7_MYCRO|nr:hypothetical protein B0H17DRAFT_1129573 [Mycena rosella]
MYSKCSSSPCCVQHQLQTHIGDMGIKGYLWPSTLFNGSGTFIQPEWTAYTQTAIASKCIIYKILTGSIAGGSTAYNPQSGCGKTLNPTAKMALLELMQHQSTRIESRVAVGSTARGSGIDCFGTLGSSVWPQSDQGPILPTVDSSGMPQDLYRRLHVGNWNHDNLAVQAGFRPGGFVLKFAEATTSADTQEYVVFRARKNNSAFGMS